MTDFNASTSDGSPILSTLVGATGNVPVTLGSYIQTAITKGGNNDLDSVLTSIFNGEHNSIDYYDALPDAANTSLGKVAYVTGGHFYRVTANLGATDGTFTSGVSPINATDIAYGFVRGTPGLTPGYLGTAVNNPGNRIWIAETQLEFPRPSDKVFYLGIDNAVLEEALGRPAQEGDLLTVTIASGTGNDAIEEDITVLYYSIDRFNDSTAAIHSGVIAIFRAAQTQAFELEDISAGSEFTVTVYEGSTTTGSRLFANTRGARGWTEINNEVFGELKAHLDRLTQDIQDQHTSLLPLLDLTALPPVTDYREGRLVVVDNNWYKLAVTDSTSPNVFSGTVGRDNFRFTSGEQWRGVANSNSPNSFSTDGSITVNPDNAIALLVASSLGRIRVAIKKSVYDTAKGSAFATSDKIAISVTFTESTNQDTAVLAYFNAYETDTNYLEFQHRLVDPDNSEAVYNLYEEAADKAFTFQFFTVDSDGNATTTPFLTHAVSTKHWVDWEIETDDWREALKLAQGNAARLDAIDYQVDGSNTPVETVTYNEDTPLDASVNALGGQLSASTTLTGIKHSDILVFDWLRMGHLGDHNEHIVPGSTDEKGRMYVNVSQFSSDEYDGEFGYALDKAVQHPSGTRDEQNSWVSTVIEISGSTLIFGLHLQNSGSRTNTDLRPPPGFSITMRVYRAGDIDTILNGSIHKQIDALAENKGFAQGPEIANITGLSGGTLRNKDWTIVDTTNASNAGTSDSTNNSAVLRLPQRYYSTNSWGILIVVTRTGVMGPISRVYVPWESFHNRENYGGFWRDTGTANNDRIYTQLDMSNGNFRLRIGCAGADDDSTVTVYEAR